MKKRYLLPCGVAALSLALAGGSAIGAPSLSRQGKLSASPTGALKFNKKTVTVRHGTVTITMVNPSGAGFSHGIAVEGHGVDKDGKTVAPGHSSVLKLKLKPGKYSFYCPVPGHEDAGMKGTLVVK